MRRGSIGWALGILGLFAGMVAGAYAWFHLGSHAEMKRLRLEPQAQVAGYQFAEKQLSPSEQQILASTNAFNGVYQGKTGDYSVFLVTWEAGKNLSVVQHTPDICWVQAGWKSINLGQPKNVKIELGDVSLVFECRSFMSPDGRAKELVVWCTLIGGLPSEEGWRFQAEGDVREPGAIASTDRALAANQFWQSLIRRMPGERSKQFVRFSTELRGDWQTALGELQSFGAQWLRVHVETP